MGGIKKRVTKRTLAMDGSQGTASEHFLREIIIA